MAKKSSRPPKRAPKPSPKSPTENRVVVRMYCQGLGDCFLLSFHGASGTPPAHVLIDCGVFQSSPGEAEKLGKIAEHVFKQTDGQIDLLVVTHEHWDHVSGFSHARSIFEKKFTFKNVWLSWAENPDDPDARLVKEAIGKNRASLAAALDRAR
ncbi:MAG: MBL fold metallo-hydrolase, partial [Isosphaeraceae bacterium]